MTFDTASHNLVPNDPLTLATAADIQRLATAADIQRIEDKLDQLISVFGEIGGQMESAVSELAEGGLGGLVKGLMGR